MQIAMMAVLAVSFFAVVIACSILGVRLFYRSRKLSLLSTKMGLKFSREDLDNLSLKYHEFALFALGHSPRASNIMNGLIDARNVCAFDLRYEIGHGTRRVCRYYQVLVVELSGDYSDLVMWNDQDIGVVPLVIRKIDGRVGCWTYAGNEQYAMVIMDIAADLADTGMCLQVKDNRLLMCIPVLAGKNYAVWLRQSLALVSELSTRKIAGEIEETGSYDDNHLEKQEYT